MTYRGLLTSLGLFVLLATPPGAPAQLFPHRLTVSRTERKLHGQLLDYTHNSGEDRRIWSPALGQKRDLYVYLPPGYDPCQRYPLILWLHGVGQDEKSFVFDVVGPLDRAIAQGVLPPVIIAVPDGSLHGRSSYVSAGSFFLNSDAGNFEDFVMGDVWDFVHSRFPIRPEREAHVIAGASMGGGAAYNLAFKYRDRARVVLAFFPPLNPRWLDCRGRYLRNFDPDCWGWRTDYSRPHEVVGRFYGVIVVRMKQVVYPLYGGGPEVAGRVSLESPIEMLDSHCIQNGELSMWVGYGGKDQFNIDAQVESFLYVAKQRGLCLDVVYDPNGKHDTATALKMMPQVLDWLRPQLAPFAPPSRRCLP